MEGKEEASISNILVEGISEKENHWYTLVVNQWSLMKSRHLTTTIFLVLQGCFAYGLVGPIGIPSGYLSGYVITPLFCWKISLKEQKKLTCTLPLRDQYFSNLSIDICDDRKSQGLIKNRFSQILSSYLKKTGCQKHIALLRLASLSYAQSFNLRMLSDLRIF